MTIAQHPDPRLLEQAFSGKPFGNAAEAADRQIGSAGDQRLRHPPVARADPDLGPGGGLPQPGDERGNKDRADIFATDHGEAPRGFLWDKIGGCQRQLKLQQTLAQSRRNFGSAPGRLHPFRTANKQIVIEHVAQSAQRMADRRLGQAQPLTSPRDAAFFDQGIEYAKQIKIERPKMDIVHLRNATFRQAQTDAAARVALIGFYILSGDSGMTRIVKAALRVWNGRRLGGSRANPNRPGLVAPERRQPAGGMPFKRP